MAFGQGKVKEEDVFDGRRIWAGIHDGLRVLSKWQAYTFSGLRVDWFDNSFGSFSCGKKSKRYPVPKSDWIPFACTVQLLSNVLFTPFFLFFCIIWFFFIIRSIFSALTAICIRSNGWSRYVRIEVAPQQDQRCWNSFFKGMTAT